MSDKNKTFSGITPAFKDAFKALIQKFNVTPVIPVAPAAPAAKFGEAKTKDGTVVKWEGEGAIAVGIAVLVIDPANPNGFLPAPDGEIEFEDGTKIVVEKGLVKEMTPAAPAIVPPAPDMPAMVAQMAKIESELSEVKVQFSAVTKEKSDLETAFKAESENNKKQIESLVKTSKELFELVAKALDAPMADPIEQPNKKIKKGLFEN